MKRLIWPLFALSLVFSVDALAGDETDVSSDVKKTICEQVASSIPQIDHMGVSVEDCVEFAEVEIVKESFNLTELNLIISAGDGYIADCSIKYVTSSLDVKGKPTCEVYVP